MNSPLRGGGVRGCSLRKRIQFLFIFNFVIVLFTTKPRRGGGLNALMECPQKKKLFFAASLSYYKSLGMEFRTFHKKSYGKSDTTRRILNVRNMSLIYTTSRTFSVGSVYYLMFSVHC